MAGFSEIEVLPMENDLWRFYELKSESSVALRRDASTNDAIGRVCEVDAVLS